MIAGLFITEDNRDVVEVRAPRTLFGEKKRVIQRERHCHVTQRVCARWPMATAELRSRNSFAKHSGFAQSRRSLENGVRIVKQREHMRDVYASVRRMRRRSSCSRANQRSRATSVAGERQSSILRITTLWRGDVARSARRETCRGGTTTTGHREKRSEARL